MLLRDQIYSRRRERESYWEAKSGLKQVNGFLVEGAKKAVALMHAPGACLCCSHHCACRKLCPLVCNTVQKS